MFRKFFLLLAVVVLVVPQVAMAGISYSGSSTIGMGVLEAGALDSFEKKTDIKFDSVDMRGSSKGIKSLIEGKVNLGGASRPLKAKEKKAKVLGTTIGYDAIAVFVHKDNPVNNLTKKQLKGIFTGKIKNWKEVGGNDAPVTPNTEMQGEGRATLAMFQKLAMDKAPYGSGFKEIDLPKDQIVHLAKNKTGICSVSLGLLTAVSASVKANVKAVAVNGIEPTPKNIKSGAYLISRPLTLGTMGRPKGDVKKFIKFILSSEGQKIVGKNFVPMR